MAKIKSLSAIKEKWTRVTPERSEDYKNGVANPKKDWATRTSAAKNAYKDGIQEAIHKDRFAKGVEAAGTDKWKRKTLDKGVERWGPGVSKAGADYEKGMKPYHDAIAGLTLPPRYAKGDPRNLERVKAVAMALRKVKIS